MRTVRRKTVKSNGEYRRRINHETAINQTYATGRDRETESAMKATRLNRSRTRALIQGEIRSLDASRALVTIREREKGRTMQWRANEAAIDDDSP